MKAVDWRKQNGITLKQLSEKIDFSDGYLCDIENGKREPSYRVMAAYLKVSRGEVQPNDFFEIQINQSLS